jgi:hypothetical protein
MSAAVQSALATVTHTELKAARKYQDDCRAAIRSNTLAPIPPTNCTEDALLVLRTVHNSQGNTPKSEKNAKLHRTKAMAMFRHLGNFHLFTTHSPDDLVKPSVHHMCSHTSSNVPGVNSEEAAALAARDPAACAIAYYDTVNTLIDMVYRFNVKTQECHPGGGLFGEVSGFFGMTEEQQRQSLHIHLLTFVKGLPQTCQDLVNIIQDPQKVKELIQYVNNTVHTQHPIATHEMLASYVSNHVCDNFPSAPEHPPPLVLCGIPEKYFTMTSSQLHYPAPPDVKCTHCETEFASLSLIKAWALQHCGADARAAWESGNCELHGIQIDTDYMFDLPTYAEDSMHIVDSPTITDSELESFMQQFEYSADTLHCKTNNVQRKCHYRMQLQYVVWVNC